MAISQISNAGIASAAGISTSKLGTGAVLQVYTLYDATGGSTTSTSRVNLSATAATITPLSTSSKLVITVNFSATVTAGGAGVNAFGYYDISEGSTAVSASQNLSVVSGSGTNVQITSPTTIIYSVSNSALTARSFYVYGYKSGGSSTVYASNIFWSIMEVAV